jgi:hypothetical protein
MSTTRTWKPSRKWLATQCTAAATVAVAWVNAGAWTKPLSIAMIGLVSQAVVGYLVSNGDPSPAASAASASGTASPASPPASAAAQPGGGLVGTAGAQGTTA